MSCFRDDFRDANLRSWTGIFFINMYVHVNKIYVFNVLFSRRISRHPPQFVNRYILLIIYVHLYKNLYVCTCVCGCGCVCVCEHVCVCVCVCVYDIQTKPRSQFVTRSSAYIYVFIYVCVDHACVCMIYVWRVDDKYIHASYIYVYHLFVYDIYIHTHMHAYISYIYISIYHIYHMYTEMPPTYSHQPTQLTIYTYIHIYIYVYIYICIYIYIYIGHQYSAQGCGQANNCRLCSQGARRREGGGGLDTWGLGIEEA
jgi:hypothetical protein